MKSNIPIILVYVLHHVINFGADGQRDKLIGVYSTREKAEEAVERLRRVVGFRDYPDLFDPTESELNSGFCIDPYTVDADHWLEGFGLDRVL